MTQLPLLSGKAVVRAFLKAGWVQFHQRGSHIILIKSGFDRTLSVPNHRELDRGTLRKLVRQSGLTVEEFITLL